MRTFEESRRGLLEAVSEQKKRIAALKHELSKWEDELYAAKAAYQELMWGDDPLVILRISPHKDKVPIPFWKSPVRYSEAIEFAHKYLLEHEGVVTHDQDMRKFYHSFQGHKDRGAGDCVLLTISPVETFAKDF